MIIKAFSLLDMKTGMFNTPFFMAHTGQAIRACMDLGQDMNTTVGRHPADFMLCEVGTFDDQTGQLLALNPLQLGTVASFLPRPQLELFRGTNPEPGAHPPGWEPTEDQAVHPNGRA